jgi:hypothetical protein
LGFSSNIGKREGFESLTWPKDPAFEYESKFDAVFFAFQKEVDSTIG